MNLLRRKRIYITGIPGTGKSSVAIALKNRGVTAISVDDDGLCSWRCNLTHRNVTRTVSIDSDFNAHHSWLCDIERLKAAMEPCADAVVVCGIVANQDAYLHLSDTVLLLLCKRTILIQRLDGRKIMITEKTSRCNSKFLHPEKHLKEHFAARVRYLSMLSCRYQ